MGGCNWGWGVLLHPTLSNMCGLRDVLVPWVGVSTQDVIHVSIPKMAPKPIPKKTYTAICFFSKAKVSWCVVIVFFSMI